MNLPITHAFATALLAASILLVPCAGQDEPDPEEAEEVAKAIAEWDADVLLRARLQDLESSGLARAQSRFGVELLRQVVASDPAANHLVAPLGAFLMLNLAAEGASPGLRDRLAAVLRVQALDRPSVQRAIGTLRERVVAREEAILDVACSVWLAKGLEPAPEFGAAALAGYDAAVAQLDFADPASAKVIDNWAAASTHGTIPAVAHALGPDRPVLGLTVTSFTASWVHHFDEDGTKPHAFTDANGHVGEVPMMHVEHSFAWLHDTTLQAQILRLPLFAYPTFEVEDRYEPPTCAFYVVLPDKSSSVPAVLERLAAEPLSWRFTFRRFARMELLSGKVWLPKFRISSQLALADVLGRMGLGDVSRAGGFTGLVKGTSLPLFEMREAATIRVDENGVAATSVDAIYPLSGSDEPTFSFVADRPFVYLLFDEVTGTLLFAGVMSRPE